MSLFVPSHIYVDKAVRDLPVTQRILAKLTSVPVEYLDSPDVLKKPIPMTQAKKSLLITKSYGRDLKSCQGSGDYVCCDFMTLSLVSNCHFECTYCILQDYLKNNPVISVFANVEEILDQVAIALKSKPHHTFRIGTGELADSLGLDPLTEFSRDLVAFTALHPNMILELKTKSNFIQNLEGLDHQGRVVVAWSLNPQAHIDQEEFKTATLAQRLLAARTVADWGYKVGFHLDPLLHFEGWQANYEDLVKILSEQFAPEEIAWISLGSLRYTKGLGAVIKDRWPKSGLLYGELFPSDDGKIRYFRGIREQMYATVKSSIARHLPAVPHYLCMETSSVWDKVFGFIPKDKMEVEGAIRERFQC
jgi:spore photoproduct lyase